MEQTVAADNYDGALQKPLQSGFSATSTAAEVISGINLSGKTAIVTGGYAGIGLETVKTLVSAGAEVWAPARDMEKASKQLGALSNVTVMTMDLMDRLKDYYAGLNPHPRGALRKRSAASAGTPFTKLHGFPDPLF